MKRRGTANAPAGSADLEGIGTRLRALLPEADRAPDVSIVVPVNARGDLDNVLRLLDDVSRYHGTHRLEVVAVVNNYDPGREPGRAADLRQLGASVVSLPSVRRSDRPGEAVCLSARIPGVRAARSEVVVLFDADCRIPNVTAVLDWYVQKFRRGAHAAYTGVGFYDFEDAMAVRVKFAIHHASRWFKRNLLGVPTTRGSNYAVRRDDMLELYDEGVLADDLNVGPAMKARKGPVAFSSARRLRVFTSGRMFTARWSRIVPYFYYRLRYNLRVLPVKEGAERRTLRERKDPAGRYSYSERT